MDKEQVGKFIASERKKCGITQKELAEQLFVTDKAVSKWERGLSYPDISQLEPLASALSVSVIEIMRGEHIEEDVPLTLETASQIVDDSLTLSDEKISRLHNRSKLMILLCLVFIMFLISFTLNIINFTHGSHTDINSVTYSSTVNATSDTQTGSGRKETAK